jgi:hypothetical protein
VTDHPLSRADRNLKAAHEYFDLARTASSPFMRAYYQRVAQRYLSSEGELSAPEGATPGFWIVVRPPPVAERSTLRLRVGRAALR